MEFTCADCPSKVCEYNQRDKMPTVCPTRLNEQEKFKALYMDELDMKLAHNAALTEAGGYGRQTRLEETMAFAYRMGYKKIGIGFCVGLGKEAAILEKVLRENGFEVAAVSCKCGAIFKEFIGIDHDHQVNKTRDFEVMCNPAGQATLLCEKGVDMCVILGLCVGHDSLFIRHCDVPVTVLSSKDRVMGHNPMAALYTADSYTSRVHTFIKDNFPESETDKK